MHTPFARAIPRALAVLLASTPALAPAGITSTTGLVSAVAAPSSAIDGAYTFPAGSPQIYVWPERTNALLTAPLAVDANAVGIYNDPSDLSLSATIAAGTRVNSYYVHFDSPAGAPANALGSITFAEPILGVIVVGDDATTTLHLDLSDFLGAPGTLYDDNLGARGMELSTNEYFRVYPGLLTIDFLMNISVPGDHVRVITAIPGAGVMPMLAIAGMIASRRRR